MAGTGQTWFIVDIDDYAAIYVPIDDALTWVS
jgi:hypothetical protein